MFKRKLKALGYLEWDKVDAHDTQHFRKVVAWLEDQKIRQYTIADRKLLRDTTCDTWPKVFTKYCKDVKCPITTRPLDQLEWLLGHAIWLEAAPEIDNLDGSQGVTDKKSKTKQDSDLILPTKCENSSGNLDFHSDEFKCGTYSLAKLLRVPRHPNHLVTLKACSKVVQKRLNSEALKNAKSNVVHNKQFSVLNIVPGFHQSDPKMEKAVKTLALLYIQDLRELQTKINEAIVTVQCFTANPKTDTRLGKVGK